MTPRLGTHTARRVPKQQVSATCHTIKLTQNTRTESMTPPNVRKAQLKSA